MPTTLHYGFSCCVYLVEKANDAIQAFCNFANPNRFYIKYIDDWGESCLENQPSFLKPLLLDLGFTLNEEKEQLRAREFDFCGLRIDLGKKQLGLSEKSQAKIEVFTNNLLRNRMNDTISLEVQDLEKLLGLLNWGCTISHHYRAHLFHLLKDFNNHQPETGTKIDLSQDAVHEIIYWNNVRGMRVPLGFGKIENLSISHNKIELFSDASSVGWGYKILTRSGNLLQSSHGEISQQESVDTTIQYHEARAWLYGIRGLKMHSDVVCYVDNRNLVSAY